MPTFTLTESAPFPPGACLCQNSTGPFVDLGFERWGEQIYLCHRCVRQVLELYEVASVDEIRSEQARADELAARVTTLAGELVAAQREAAERSAERDRLAERNSELVAERAGMEAVVAGLKAGPSLIEAAKAEIKPRRTPKAREKSRA